MFFLNATETATDKPYLEVHPPASFDGSQLWELIALPDNVPIVLMLILLIFYLWYAFRQARANDKLIAQLEADPELAKTHHRKFHPWHPSWDKTVSVWPHLLKREFLAAIIVTAFLIVWSVFLNAPLEDPANPTLTMNPSKAPWYFLGLQEILVYFDPWIAGVVLPFFIVGGLMAIPYIDVNPLGNGYYTWKQRRFAISVFMFGFLVLWVALVILGTFMRGPGWMFFYPGETWDHLKVVYETNRDLHEMFGITSTNGKLVFGGLVCLGFCAVASGAFHALFRRSKMYPRMSLLQYAHLQIFMVTMLALPVKMLLRLAFNVKYVWVTPWFNI
ncbi:MAG: cytochrome C [Planctomycetes bacterium]|nr:cytochrome C [Planctomycetota bacterium]